MGMYGADSRPVVKCGEGRTKQSFRSTCDINKMVERYRKTGVFSNVNGRAPFYGDVSDIRNYQESLDVVIKARALFDGLPAKIRERFDNDPAALVAFLGDRRNLEEAVRLGICSKPVGAAPDGDAKPAADPGKPVLGSPAPATPK